MAPNDTAIALRSLYYAGMDGVGFGPCSAEPFRKLWLFTGDGRE